MNLKNISLTFIVMLFLFFSTFLIVFYGNQDKQPIVSNEQPTTTETPIKVEEKPTENIGKINEDGSVQVLDSNFEENEKITYDDAIISKKVKNCEKIIENDLIETCILKLGECDSDECFQVKAQMNRDEEICFEIENETLKISCTAQIKYSEIIDRSIIEQNILICNEFIEETSISRCEDNFFFATAVNSKNKELCENIIAPEVKNECIKNI